LVTILPERPVENNKAAKRSPFFSQGSIDESAFDRDRRACVMTRQTG
jgi:hypothetical protein